MICSNMSNSLISTNSQMLLLRFYLFSAVFTWTNLLVVVVELDGSESEALDLVALVTSAVLEEHHLVVGVVVVVDPGVVPINSRGEKQRMHLRDGFLADQLDPIYVAYNMWTNVREISAPSSHRLPYPDVLMLQWKFICEYLSKNLAGTSLFSLLSSSVLFNNNFLKCFSLSFQVQSSPLNAYLLASYYFS